MRFWTLGCVFTATAWAALTVAFLYAGRRWKLQDLEWQSYALAAMAFARCWASNFYSPAQFATYIQSEMKRVADTAKENGISIP